MVVELARTKGNVAKVAALWCAQTHLPAYLYHQPDGWHWTADEAIARLRSSSPIRIR